MSVWSELDTSQIDLVAKVLLEFTRDESRRVPPPRGMPFYGLDHVAGEFSPYEHLTARGIFRKYESVLLLEAGLGGAARWCHAHFGCEVTGIERVPAVARAAQALSARARLSSHTQFLAGHSAALPLRQRQFTHVWAVEGWQEVAPRDTRLQEIFRVVRLGGLAALQQGGAAAGWESRACESLTSVGFAEATAVVVERPPLRESTRRARARFTQVLRAWPDPLGAATAAALERLYDAPSVEGGPVAQVVGRRPS